MKNLINLIFLIGLVSCGSDDAQVVESTTPALFGNLEVACGSGSCIPSSSGSSLVYEALTSSPEENAGKAAQGFWSFYIDSAASQDHDQSVFEFVKEEIIANVADEMVSLGYPTCADIPTSGSELITNGTTTVDYSTGTNTIPAGSNWDISGTTYEKRIRASVGANEFAEIQFNCTSDTNVYIKYDFNQFDSLDRVAEFYLQKGAGGKINLEMQSTCLNATECALKTNMLISFHTPDGNEVKVVGMATEDGSGADEVKGLSIHAFANSQIADIHFMDQTNLLSTDDFSPSVNVSAVCVDFSIATYIAANGTADCTGVGAAANITLQASESDAFGVGDIEPATISSLNVTY